MSDKSREKALEKFAEAKFGMFIHFGLYSILGRGEWVQHVEKIPPDQYRHLEHLWNCRDFDAGQIVLLAKQAGMNYITFTTRHHDGFSLFDTDLSDYKSTNSAARRDIVREITEACRKHGLMIFYYYSLPDWHREDYVNNFKQYREFVKGQLRELLTRYGRIDGIWFDNLLFHHYFPDGEPLGYPIEDWNITEMYDLIHELQPHAIIGVNRVGSDLEMPLGDDIDLSEYHVPEHLLRHRNRPLEVCDTLTPGVWGWDTRLSQISSARQVIEKLLTNCGKEFNLLMNVGPEKFGAIPDNCKQVLREVGLFTKKYAQAIYAATPKGECEGNYLVEKEGELFAYLLKKDKHGSYRLPLPESPVEEVFLLASGNKVKWTIEHNSLVVEQFIIDSDPWIDIVKIRVNGGYK